MPLPMDADEFMSELLDGRKNFRGENLSQANLQGEDLRGVNLYGANLKGACLVKTDLCGVDLREADLSNAYLCQTRLEKAKLQNACLVAADLSLARLHQANLDSADLNSAILFITFLIKANLSNADLSYTILRGADLSNAKLAGASLRGVDLSQTKLDGVNLEGVVLDGAKMPEDLQSADKQISNQGILFNPKWRLYTWEGLRYRSKSEIEIAKALDRAGVLFIPNSLARLNSPEGRRNLEPDFIVCHQGKWGILEVDGPWHTPSRRVEEQERERLFRFHGIRVVERFDSKKCEKQPNEVVKEFLQMIEGMY
ncbi:pentapeptide repeat-containing protein [Nostoc sp.]|uniref:pentapeptide repeat-containing protein n=1 Tax=Nostoc sp. TaxID=1180 RepID=UPI002FFA386B